jgi:hypothetical protein
MLLDVYIGLLLWNKLSFAGFCKEQIQEGKEEIPWSVMASILVLAPLLRSLFRT